ncbi:ubiquitin-ubiquitin ligase BUL2 NDAI_0E00330 [Naumovozyma dairenensis CBS 421]|uniref:BUL2 n=1 Tax=Naumovozyma dairenensis (strain ATCC 10597 / BCRC 20456 / CBS 421 / NBRC 0211 / NRRL Y-12639) TaxID=1071378 RepID=G0WAS9_NAUDC|nr:hypothetical protein NDAI_0E00330 [Naumovozyma dairenensis CBS 421]CCD24849.1 hypothetical protein NDAI_0E00330 [Naumovozyma dairenensis CBS 421]
MRSRPKTPQEKARNPTTSHRHSITTTTPNTTTTTSTTTSTARRPLLRSNPTADNIHLNLDNRHYLSKNNNKKNSDNTNHNDQSEDDNINGTSQQSNDNLQAMKSASMTNLQILGRSELSHGTNRETKVVSIAPPYYYDYNPNINEHFGNDINNNTNGEGGGNNSLGYNMLSNIELGTTTTDQTNNLLVDVLPSFYMYNVLHRHIPQGNVDPDIHDYPPNYQETITHVNPLLSNASTNDTTATTTANENIVENLTTTTMTTTTPPSNNTSSSNLNILNNLHPLNTRHYNISSNTNSTSHINNGSSSSTNELHTEIEDDLNDSDSIIIDKLYSLPKLATPIEIDIRVTKNVSKPHIKNEEESILKEYTSGDIIHGYCIIENRSSQRLKFEMFYVTLEAYISIIDNVRGKRTVKRFLRMVDLSASWSYTDIDLSSGINLVPGQIDSYDNSIIGLKNNRILEPKTKYKKFFMFKLPNQLLDITCKQEQFSHCLLPPSFGIDRYKNSRKYSSIKVNNVLGCGHLGVKGSPILTSDISDENVSINYTIDARIVGKDLKTQKLNIMKEKEYNLRVIPFGFGTTLTSRNVFDKQLKDLRLLIQDRIDALEKVFERLKNDEPIINSDIHSNDLSGTIDSDTELLSAEILRRKMDQLHINNRLDDNSNVFNDFKNMSPKENIIESELSYRIKMKHKSSPNLKNVFFPGFLSGSHYSTNSVTTESSLSTDSIISNNIPQQSSTSSSTIGIISSNRRTPLQHVSTTEHQSMDKSGLIVISTQIPKASLPYLSPSLLRKTNKFENKNRHDQENWLRLSRLNTDEENTELTKLEIKLTCLQSNNSTPHNPPQIQSVNVELLAINGKSDNSIPIKLQAAALLNEEKLSHITMSFKAYQNAISNYRKGFRENLMKLNELFNVGRTLSNARVLEFTDFITDQMRNDIESLCNLEVERIPVPDIFVKSALKQNVPEEKIPSTGSSSLTTPWIKCGPSEYQRKLILNLEYSEKNNNHTLIPDFESCLCCRFYCIRVQVKFENHIGLATIDIPVSVKKLNS